MIIYLLDRRQHQRYFRLNIIILLFGFLSIWGCSDRKTEAKVSLKELKENFEAPPNNMKPWSYFYWHTNHVSKIGITKDLEAMARAGIGTALIANMNERNLEQGKVEMLSEEWKELTRHAIREGGRLGMDIGLFNCPGFSSSGGPWNDFSNSMKYIDYTETRLTGGKSISIKLDAPEEKFEDVRLLGFPARPGEVFDNQTFNISSDKNLKNLKNLLDNDSETVVDIADFKELVLNFQSDRKETIRNIEIVPSKSTFIMDVDLYGEINGEWEKVKSFRFNRSNDKNELGFDDYAPVSVSFPKMTSDKFKLELKNITPTGGMAAQRVDKNIGIADIRFSSQVNLEHYLEKSLAKMNNSPIVPFDTYSWPDQPEPEDKELILMDDKIINLSDKLSIDGVLTWDAPEGDWVVLRFVMKSTGVKNESSALNATGYEADKLDKGALRQHFDGYVGDIIYSMPPEDRKALKYIIAESYEVGAQNWTNVFADRFLETYNYDPEPYLPVLTGIVVNSVEESSRFLWDLRRLVADGLAYEYIAGLRELCEENGLQLWLENYGHWGFPSEFLMYGGQSNLVAGEFWTEGLGGDECRAAASAAHIYGKNTVYAESFTSSTGGKPFTTYPEKMKKRGDWSFTEGINHVVYHVYIHQAYEDKFPGVNAWFGSEINRKNTWFEAAGPWMKYHQRCNYLLQQGTYVADVAYYIGEDAPKMTGPTEPKLPQGYSFDFINAEVIKNRVSVDGGRMILPDGMSYRILILPDSETIRPEVLEKIKDLVYDGAIIMGNPPTKSPSLENYGQADKRVLELSKELWGESYLGTKEIVDFGKGKVIRLMDLDKALNLINVVPDLKYSEETPILWIHRTLGDKEIYFLSNQSDNKISFDASFRVNGMYPSLWDATNGTARGLPEYSVDGLYTKVPLQLEPSESAFVVFDENREGLKDSGTKNYGAFALLQDISKEWGLRLKNDQMRIDEKFELDQLQDLSQMENETIKYFSGNIIYNTDFLFEDEAKNERIFLDLGKVAVIAKVKLNGKEIGGLWTAPWRLDISDYLKNGKNNLEIEVVNLWVNQLVEDSGRDKNERKTWTLTDHDYSNNSPLPASGLIGPVQLLKASGL